MARLNGHAIAVGAAVAAIVALTHAARRRRRAWRADRATSAPWPQRWANASQANGFADQGPQEGNGRAVSTRTGTGSSRSAIPGPDTGSGLDADAARYIADQYRRLLELGALISAKTNVTDACEKLIQAAAGIVGAERVTLLVVDRMSSDLYVAASDCPAADAPGSDDSCRIPLDESTFAGSCATNGHIVNVADTLSDSRGFRPGGGVGPVGGGGPATSALCAPVRDRKGRVIAVLEAQHRVRSGPAVPASLQPSHSGFSATDERLISKLAEFSGTALDKLTLFERSEADRHRMHGLVRVMERLASELSDVDRLMEAITDAAYSLVSAERVALMMVDADEQQLVICVSQDARNVRIPIGKGIAGHVARTGETVVVDDVREDPRFLHDVDRRVGFLTKAVLCVPVWDASHRVVGVVQAINNRQRRDARFSTEDREVMETLAVTAGIAIRNALLHQEAVQGKETATAVLSMVAAMAAEDDVERLYRKVLRAVHRLVPACVSVLYLVDEAEKEVWVACGPADVIGKRFPLGSGLAGYVAAAGKAMNLADVRTHPLVQGRDPLSAALTALSEKKAREADQNPAGGAASPDVTTAVEANPRHRSNSLSRPSTPPRRVRSTARSKRRPAEGERPLHRSHSPPNRRVAAARAAGRNWLAKALATDAAPPPLTMDMAKASGGGGGGDEPESPGNDSVLGSPLAATDKRRGPSAHAMLRARSRRQSMPTPRRRMSASDLLSCSRTGSREGVYSALALPITSATQSSNVLGVVELRGPLAGECFTANDVRAVQALLVEVGNVLRTHSVQAAITRVLSKGAATSNSSTVEVEASLLLEYVAGRGNAAAHGPLVRQLSRASRGAGAGDDAGEDGESDVDSYESSSPNRGSSVPDSVRASASWLLDPYYDHFRAEEGEMLQLAGDAFHYFNLPRHFAIPDATLRNFLSAVRDRYSGNPFHNFAHAFSVLQLSFRILVEGKARALLGSRDILALLVAAICHDLEHPGHNNGMEVALGSPLALLHNDDAVLERHHAHTAFVLLQNKEMDLFASLSSADRAKARRTVLQAILATEMGKHFDHVNELLRRAETDEPFDAESADDRDALVSAILHTADLGAQALPWFIARVWGERVLREFAQQARREQALNLPVTKFMEDVDVDEYKGLRVQVQFVGNVVEPLWNAMSQILPGLQTMRDQVVLNREQYRKLLEERKAQLAAEEGGKEVKG